MLIDHIETEPAGDCHACGSAAVAREVQVERWTFRFCAECGLGRLDPRPTPAAEPGLYEEDYWARTSVDYEAANAELQAGVRDQHRRVRFLRRYQPTGRLLDVGCGTGLFLAAARDAGYEVMGLERSKHAAAKGRDLLNLDIVNAGMDDFDFAGGHFDVISLHEVLEHFYDPTAELKRLRTALAPAGLLIVEVPNCAGWDARAMGAAWGQWQPPFHLWHFTPASLQRVLKRAGFAVRGMDFASSAYMRERLRRVPGLKVLRAPIALLFRGNTMRVAAGPA